MSEGGKRRLANPLALAVLACLREKPMHPYEVAATLKRRHRDDAIRLSYGALYAAVEGLCRNGMICAEEKERAGNRPERTIYRLTEAGSRELEDWLAELISEPAREYTAFGAGLALIGVLPPAEAARLLGARCKHLETALADARSMRERLLREGVERPFIDTDFREHLLAAELAFVQRLIGEIAAGKLAGLDLQRGRLGGEGKAQAGPAARKM